MTRTPDADRLVAALLAHGVETLKLHLAVRTDGTPTISYEWIGHEPASGEVISGYAPGLRDDALTSLSAALVAALSEVEGEDCTASCETCPLASACHAGEESCTPGAEVCTDSSADPVTDAERDFWAHVEDPLQFVFGNVTESAKAEHRYEPPPVPDVAGRDVLPTRLSAATLRTLQDEVEAQARRAEEQAAFKDKIRSVGVVLPKNFRAAK